MAWSAYTLLTRHAKTPLASMTVSALTSLDHFTDLVSHFLLPLSYRTQVLSADPLESGIIGPPDQLLYLQILRLPDLLKQGPGGPAAPLSTR